MYAPLTVQDAQLGEMTGDELDCMLTGWGAEYGGLLQWEGLLNSLSGLQQPGGAYQNVQMIQSLPNSDPATTGAQATVWVSEGFAERVKAVMRRAMMNQYPTAPATSFWRNARVNWPVFNAPLADRQLLIYQKGVEVITGTSSLPADRIAFMLVPPDASYPASFIEAVLATL